MPCPDLSRPFACALLLTCSLACMAFGEPGQPAPPTGPIALHPENPHYFLFRGRPAALITSGEHYGALLNLDFDYRIYLAELQDCGLNLTRTFTGVYCEAPGSFGIRGNPLAPAANRLTCPWARSDRRGYANGGAKFDLSRWDAAYFARLKDFLAEADRRAVVVELVLFCPFYKDEMWQLSPMNAKNNVNGVGRAERNDVYSMKHDDLQEIQEAVVRKIVTAVNAFDNLYFEICNEPYFGGVTMPWQERIAKVIVQTEASLPKKHLIAQNIANGRQKIERPNPAVSVFNFHYATPPDAVAMNFGLNRVIGDDETGFDGNDDFTYRAEGWNFIIAGGGVYSNLDYSFTPEREDGTAVPDAPGGGGRALRRQLAVLSRFLHDFNFLRMRPDDAVLVGKLPKGTTARALVETGRQYAVYVRGEGVRRLAVELPSGEYRAEWVDTKTGEVDRREKFDLVGGRREISAPAYEQDVALRIVRR